MKLSKSETAAIARQLSAHGKELVADQKEKLRESLRKRAVVQMQIFQTLDPVIQKFFSNSIDINDFLDPLVNQKISNGYLLEVKKLEVLYDEITLALRDCNTVDEIKARVRPLYE